jgi:hypothetical protein
VPANPGPLSGCPASTTGFTLFDLDDSITAGQSAVNTDRVGFVWNPGGSSNDTISLLVSHVTAANDALTVIPMPAGMSVTFDPVTVGECLDPLFLNCGPARISNMSVSTTTATPPGQYIIHIAGTSVAFGGATNPTIGFHVTVLEALRPSFNVDLETPAGGASARRS